MVHRLDPILIPRAREALAFDALWAPPALSFDTPEGWEPVPGQRIAMARRNDAVRVGRIVRSIPWPANLRVNRDGRSMPLYQALFELVLTAPLPSCRTAQALVDQLDPLEPLVCPILRVTTERLWVCCPHRVGTDEPFRVFLLPEHG